MFRAVVFLSVIILSESSKFPSILQKCNRNQPDVKQCLLKAAHDGLPKFKQAIPGLKLPNLDPFHIVKVNIGAGTSAVAVEQKFNNCSLYGIGDLDIQHFDLDPEKRTLEGDGLIQNITILCQYELDGRVLLLPIKGRGPSTIILTNVFTKGAFKYEETKKKHMTYAKFVSSVCDITPEHVSYQFDNLFDGDKQLGENINKVLNDNWKEVFDDVKSGYIHVINTILVNVLNTFFSQVSLEEALD